ncbi:MAG: hypothetical protein R3358_00240 [Woeseiaceae bacterium]|nr:hypothetical protein [Woeseiaceae bacterium]
MTQIISRLLVLAAILACSSSWSQDGDGLNGKVVVYIEKTGKFEVLHNRAESTNTGAALFGLLGVAVEESGRTEKDNEREEAILEHIPDDACHNYLVSAMTARLAEKGYLMTVVEDKMGKADDDAFAVRLKIDHCGYRIVNAETDELSAYLAGQYQVLEPGEKKRRSMESVLVTGDLRATWDVIVENPDASVSEFRAVKSKAGRRLANTIIYYKR